MSALHTILGALHTQPQVLCTHNPKCSAHNPRCSAHTTQSALCTQTPECSAHTTQSALCTQNPECCAHINPGALHTHNPECSTAVRPASGKSVEVMGVGSRGHPWPQGLQAGDGHGPHLVEVATTCVDGHAACFPGDPESFPPGLRASEQQTARGDPAWWRL